MAPTRLQIAKKDIIQYIDDLNRTILTRQDLGRILKEHRGFWRLAEATTVDGFISFLVEKSHLRELELLSQHGYRRLVRYYWRDEPSPYELSVSLRARSYLSHFSAVLLHDLTQQIPKTIYVNQEQSPKPRRDSTLEQHRIDTAFKSRPRTSKLVYTYGSVQIVLLSGKNTGNLGVIDMEAPDGRQVPVTNLERTLIDIVVRPHYAGGIEQVRQAYTAARGRASLNKLVAILRDMDLLYPYQQAIGFLAERAGFGSRPLVLLREFGLEFDFYLLHGMTETEYSKEWRLFYPKGF
ncbi:MAG TPA: hypothetical protein VM118_06275 [Acidobacteriota bacterium]|nr:hypothetical protein [Acidobacteriota bacterium]